MSTGTHDSSSAVPDGLLATLYRDDTSQTLRDWMWRDIDSFSSLILRWVGTGGSLAECAAALSTGTSGYPTFRNEPREALAEALNDIADKIALIRSTLSLNVKELAAALHVRRPTVYAWIAGTAQPQQINRRRIDAVVAVARRWAEMETRPLGDLKKETGSGGRSIMAELESDEIDTDQVRGLLAAAAAKLERRKKPTKGIGIAQRAKERGVVFTAPPDAQREIDRVTGKRIASE